MVGVRVAMEGVARHGRNMILPVLLGDHAQMVDSSKATNHCFGRYLVPFLFFC